MTGYVWLVLSVGVGGVPCSRVSAGSTPFLLMLRTLLDLDYPVLLADGQLLWWEEVLCVLFGVLVIHDNSGKDS